MAGATFDVGKIQQELYEAYVHLRPGFKFPLTQGNLYSHHIVPKARIVIGGHSFNVFMSVVVTGQERTSQSGRIRAQRIPGTQHVLPIGLWAAFTESSADELHKSLVSINEWKTAFKNNGLMGFADVTTLKEPEFFGVREIVAKHLYPAGENVPDESFAAGMWFVDDVVVPFQGNQALQTIGHYVPTLTRHYPAFADWVHANPPPRTSNFEAQEAWLKKAAFQLIKAGWSVVSGGVIETPAKSLSDFQSISRDVKKELRALKWPDEANVTLHLQGGRTEVVAWEQVVASQHYHMADLADYVEEITVTLAGFCDALNAGEGPTLKASGVMNKPVDRVGEKGILNKPNSEDTSEALLRRIDIVLTEGRQPLSEAMNYNQLVAATRDAWEKRFETVKTVRPTPPEAVLLDDGNINLRFNYWSRPSTEGKSHKGSVEFVPDKPKKKEVLTKLASWWDDMKAKFKKFTGQKIPAKVLKASDLRQMKCSVSCDCKDFLYRMEVANHKKGASPIKHSNGKAPEITNPGMNPGLCKHLLSLLVYLTDDANIEIAREPKKVAA